MNLDLSTVLGITTGGSVEFTDVTQVERQRKQIFKKRFADLKLHIFTVKILYNHPKISKYKNDSFPLVSGPEKYRFSCFSRLHSMYIRANVTYIIYNIFILNIHTGERSRKSQQEKQFGARHALAHFLLRR